MSANETNFVAAVYDRRFRILSAVIDRRYSKRRELDRQSTSRFAPCGETSFVPRSPRSALSSASARSSPWLGLARARKPRWKRRLPAWGRTSLSFRPEARLPAAFAPVGAGPEL